MVEQWISRGKEFYDIIRWQQSTEANAPFDAVFQCQSRDIFQAKLDAFYQETKDALLVAVAGEIGNNSFDHNLGKWKDIAGVYFKYILDKSLLIISDRGQGIKKTLSRIIPDIHCDKDAVEIAFTKVISGRSPEQRGNGLKFVASAVKDRDWDLYFQSGNGVARINNNGYVFLSEPEAVFGCLAILEVQKNR